VTAALAVEDGRKEKFLRVSRGLAALSAGCVIAAGLFSPSCLFAQESPAEQIPVLEGHIKLGVSSIVEDGNASSTTEAYNLSRGLRLSSFFLRGVAGEARTITVDLHDMSRHQANASVEFSETGLLNVKFDYSRLRYLESASANSRSVRDAVGVSGNLTPTKWLKLFGGVNDQERRGNRVAYLTDNLDFPGSLYDYSIKSRTIGAQLRASQRSLEVSHEWRRFRSEANSPLNRDGRRLRVAGTYTLSRAVALSGSYVSDESVLERTDDAVDMRSYSGVLELRPVRSVTLAGYANHKNTQNDVTGQAVKTLSAGGKVDLSLRRGVFLEGGYEFTKRNDEPDGSDPDLAERQVSTDAINAGMTARLSERARLTVRYKTKNTDRTLYRGLTGPFDTDYFLAKVEGWAAPTLQYAVSFEDKERSNDELMSSSWTRGPALFADWTLALPGRTVGLRLNGSGFRNSYSDVNRSFETDNILVTARLRVPVFSRLTAEAGVTHIDVRGDLDIRKDLVAASLAYAVGAGYTVEARYDLFSYDDFLSYQDNYAANVFTISMSKRFSALGRGE